MEKHEQNQEDKDEIIGKAFSRFALILAGIELRFK